MLIEELSETIHSASKDLYRNQPNTPFKEKMDHFAEELADAQLMIDEFVYFFDLDIAVQYFRSVKVQKLEELLK